MQIFVVRCPQARLSPESGCLRCDFKRHQIMATPVMPVLDTLDKKKPVNYKQGTENTFTETDTSSPGKVEERGMEEIGDREQ